MSGPRLGALSNNRLSGGDEIISKLLNCTFCWKKYIHCPTGREELLKYDLAYAGLDWEQIEAYLVWKTLVVEVETLPTIQRTL